jgi:hypothetical protein
MDGEDNMPKYRILTTNTVVYEHIVEADTEKEAIQIVDDGDSDCDWLDAHTYEIESVERIED